MAGYANKENQESDSKDGSGKSPIDILLADFNRVCLLAYLAQIQKADLLCNANGLQNKG